MKKIFFTHTLLAALLLLGCKISAKEYKVYQMARIPVIDGDLSDHSWQRIPAGRGFRLLKKGNPYAQERFTTFKMGWKGDYLYLALSCEEPDLKSIKAVTTYRDGWFFDDAVEMFFLPAEQKKFMQLMVNSKGALWCRIQDEGKVPEPPSDLRIASGRTKDGWSVEMAIPLRYLKAKDVEKMRFNLGRNLPGVPWEKISCWADVITAYSEVKNFAVMRKSLYNGPANPEEAEEALNFRYDTVLGNALHQIAIKGKEYKNLVSRFGKTKEFSKVESLQKEIAATYRKVSKSCYGKMLRNWRDTVKAATIPRKELACTVRNAPASLEFFVNGKKILPRNGKYVFPLEEGVTTLCFSGISDGRTPLPVFDFSGEEVLNTRWAYAQNAPKEWMSMKMDDRSWKAPGKILPKGKFHLRQVLLWNQGHDGKLRCINPTIRSWGFSPDSTETLYLSLYSPTGLRVNSFDFILDLPEGFSLLDMEPGARRNRLSLAPLKVTSRSVTVQGKKYTRNILSYNPRDIHEWKTADSILGIRKDASGKAGSKDVIRYARRINGNVTEIGGTLPVHILPPIRGKQLRKMILSYYQGSIPQELSRELVTEVVKSSVKAGVDTFSVYPVKRMKNDVMLANGGKLIMGYLNHPIWGAKVRDGHIVRLLDANTELYAEFFTGERILKQPPRTPAHLTRYQFCPSLVTTRYKKAFTEALKGDYRDYFFKIYPDSKYIFLNWEQEPWCNTIYTKAQIKDIRWAYCFCALCKKNFRSFAKIPAGVKLSNETIFRKYYEEWRLFRYSLDAQVHAIVVDVLASMGKKALFYSWSNHFGYWEAAKNVPYHVFLGCPGNGTADRRQQINMDTYMKFHEGKMGRKNIVGQRFVFFSQSYGWKTDRKEGWLKFNVMSDDGYVHPETWKWETLRICSTLKGGLDFQNPLELAGGIKYYVGEATRLIAEYEDIFYHGTRKDSLAVSKEIAYPDLTVLEYGKKRLVFAYNEGSKPRTATIRNLKLSKGAKAKAFYGGKKFANASQVKITIPANDVEVIYIEQ
ncbi:MAG: carbohydrate-binding family 9-like protein [Lentisphaeria bacterium]|nr:carbohydrate-binding family 9-like protein [Lentisphaeria bacterium]